jgi:L-ascorbate metabolism protein UlaG (beta-lactamase superfamily)
LYKKPPDKKYTTMKESGQGLEILQRKWLPILVTAVIVAISVYGCKEIKAVGKNPSGEALKRIEALPNYKNGQFQNLDQRVQQPAIVNRKRKPGWRYIFKFFSGQSKEVLPSKPLLVAKTDLVNTTFDNPTVIWFGHSSFLLKAGTANILFDPTFSGFAGPFKGAIKAFEGSNVYDERDMPVIDALVISHDHYDHLDYITVKRLRKKVRRIIVPIGVGSHFVHWGFSPAIITELNWNDSVKLTGSITITATPAHHRSNRTFEQKKTLWASYVVRADGYKIFFSGDTGYSTHFKIIGQQYGPFDLAMMECGQYNVRWPQSHMFPHQTVQAAIDIGAAMTIPVHWGKYAESEHAWNEPVNLLMKAADSLKVPVTVPYPGQPYTIGTQLLMPHWWNFF